jgi:hypothetical protein
MINGHLDSWLGRDVQLFDTEAAKKGNIDYKKFIYRLAVEWEDESTIRDLIYRFVEDPKSIDTPAIIIGAFSGDDHEQTSQGIVELLVSSRAKLPNLKGIFLGDIVSEENEISWINQSDVSPLFAAYPKLEHFRVRGANGLSFGRIQHSELKSLVVESGGMARTLVEEISQCEFPNLEHLELWLGTAGYGWDGTMSDVRPFLNKNKYPKLKYLGLKNSDLENEIAAEVVKSEILPQLRILDLSLGVLTDEGGAALLACNGLGHLEKLDLHFHYLSTEMQNKLSAKLPNVDLSDVQDGYKYKGEIQRYVSVGE